MTLLWKADYSQLNDSAQAGFTNTHRQTYTGGIVTNGAPVPAFSHPKLGNCLEHTLGTDGYRLEAMPQQAANLSEGREVYIRFDFTVPANFPVNQGNYFLCINQIHSANPSTSPPLEFDIYNGGLYTRGYNWVAKVPNQIRHRLTTVVPGEVYSVVYYCKFSDKAEDNRISVWVNGKPALTNLAPGYPLIDPAKTNSYWKGSTLYADRNIARPLTVYQSNHMIGTELADVMPAPSPETPPSEPDPNPTDVTAMPSDFAYVEVQISPTADFAFYTVIDKLTGAGSTVASGLSYGDHYWVRLVAVDWSGNRSEPSEPVAAKPEKLVNVDLGPDAVDRFNIRNAAIGSAQIDNLAVNDAHIANLNVGKLTAGSLKAEIITAGGSIRTGTFENGVSMDNQGLYMFDQGVLKIWIRSGGEALFTGRIQSAMSGVRWEGHPSGDFRFYKANNVDYASFAWDETNNRMLLRGPLTGVGWNGSDINSGWLHLGKNYARIQWGRPGDGLFSSTAMVEVNNTQVHIVSRNIGVRIPYYIAEDNTQPRMFWAFQDNRGSDFAILHLEGHLIDVNNQRPMLRHPAGNTGLLFGFNRLQSKDFQGNFKDIECNVLRTVSGGVERSSREVKHDIKAPEFSAREVVKDLKVQQFRYNDYEPERIHYGWIAEDVQEVLPDIVYEGIDNVISLSPMNVAAFAVRLGEENSDVIEDLQRQIDELKKVRD